MRNPQKKNFSVFSPLLLCKRTLSPWCMSWNISLIIDLKYVAVALLHDFVNEICAPAGLHLRDLICCNHSRQPRVSFFLEDFSDAFLLNRTWVDLKAFTQGQTYITIMYTELDNKHTRLEKCFFFQHICLWIKNVASTLTLCSSSVIKCCQCRLQLGLDFRCKLSVCFQNLISKINLFPSIFHSTPQLSSKTSSTIPLSWLFVTSEYVSTWMFL